MKCQAFACREEATRHRFIALQSSRRTLVFSVLVSFCDDHFDSVISEGVR